ncbi:ABC transporter permease [Pajaroellobacter abortibovis]|uniref:ABC transporter permease n=1 Tax=Pajaroellobacter abortibovis TaxID=1882918 RepID=A0A1L6MY91_9BACT|nr:ABC transporter permease [Pajaroellobacter abortibovis]APS00514.1 ABC transporter permease [Pajaroellobacter abortibovis]
MPIELLQTGLLQGLILSIVALGVFIPFRLLNFPDLTAEGSYPVGGAICSSLLVAGISPAVAVLVACISAGFLGICTGMVHFYFHVDSILAGIILSTMTYSVNLRWMGKPNIALFSQSTFFSSFSENEWMKIGFIASIVAGIVLLLSFFLRTEKGLRFRAVGLNPSFAERQGISLKLHILVGLFVGNALCGLAGSLMVQVQGYADINMGVGIVIHALAGVMIGERFLKVNAVLYQPFLPVLGAALYQQIQGLALALGLAPSDLKLLTGGIVLGVLKMHPKPL